MKQGNNGLKRLLVFIMSCVISCASAPTAGDVSESHSDYTGVTELTMEPAWLYESTVRLALYKTTKMREKDVIVVAVLKGNHEFSMGDSLYFTVDGETVSFRSIDLQTNVLTTEGFYGSHIELPEKKYTTRDYVVSKDFIKQLIGADQVIVEVRTRLNEFEGTFSHDAPTMARPAFREFYKKLEVLK